MPSHIAGKGRVAIAVGIREAARAGAGTALEWSYDKPGERTIAT